MAKWKQWLSAVVRVGDGRGFVVENDDERLVITAMHCLPELPIAHGASYIEERTYRGLLGPVGDGQTVWAECLFADPIADLAVLGEAHGWDAVFTWESLWGVDAWVSMAAASMQTSTIRMGTNS